MTENNDYRRLYEQQTKVLNETEALRRGLMDSLIKRHARIKHLERMLRAARQLFYMMLVLVGAFVLIWTLFLLPYYLEFYNV